MAWATARLTGGRDRSVAEATSAGPFASRAASARAGLTLAGVVRDGTMNVYTGAHRVSGPLEEVRVVD